MYRKSILAFLIIFLVRLTAESQPVIPQKIVPGAWIREWLLCGPFPLQKQTDPSLQSGHLAGFSIDYLKKAGGEKNPLVHGGDVIKFRNGSAKWKPYLSPEPAIDLDKAVSANDPVMAYAYAEIESEASGIWFISLGSNDGGTMIINGVTVWDFAHPRGLSPDDDIFPVLLQKGINKLLLKIEDRGNQWGFCLRFQQFSVEKLTENSSLFTIITNSDGEASMASKVSASVLEQLVSKIEIDVTNQEEKSQFIKRDLILVIVED